MIRKFIGLMPFFLMDRALYILTFLIPVLLLLYCVAAERRVGLICLFLLVLIGITYLKSKDESMLFTLLFVMALGHMSPKPVIRGWFYLQGTVLGLCILSYTLLYVAGSNLAVTGVIDGRFRYYFMFDHPNNFAAQVFFCLLAFIYLYSDRISRGLTCLILALTAIFLYEFPNSLTATVMTVLTLLFLLGTWYLKKIMKAVYGILIGIICFFAFGVVSVIYFSRIGLAAALFYNSFYIRLYCAAAALRIFPLTLFGRQMETGNLFYIDGEWQALWFDESYTRVFLAFGIIMGLFFVMLLFSSLMMLAFRERYMEALVLAMICCYALSEWSAFSVSTAWGLVFLSEGFPKSRIYLRY